MKPRKIPDKDDYAFAKSPCIEGSGFRVRVLGSPGIVCQFGVNPKPSRVGKAKIPVCVRKTACSVMLPAGREHCHPARRGLPTIYYNIVVSILFSIIPI